MSLLTPAEVQAAGVGLDFTTADLQAVIDREEAEIVRRFGANYVDANTTITESVEIKGPSVFLKRAILSVASVTEVTLVNNYQRTLATTDYYAWRDQTGRVQRLLVGNWYGDRIDVVYVPQDDTNLRKLVLIELCRIATNAPVVAGAVRGLSFGLDTTRVKGDAITEREAQFDRLVLVPGV